MILWGLALVVWGWPWWVGGAPVWPELCYTRNGCGPRVIAHRERPRSARL